MSIHSSLRTPKGAAAAARNVMKRHERVRHLLTLGTWEPGRSVLGLPKIKPVKVKVRKAAAKEKEAAATEPAAAAPASASG
jgi:small basic protein (TIGR04137 family)